MVRLRTWLLVAAGLVLIATSVAWDWLRGAEFGFGRKQFAGYLAGAALIVAAVWLRRGAHGASSPRPWSMDSLHWLRWAAVLLLVAPATILTARLSAESLFASASWLFWCYVAALCLLMPLRFGWLLFAVMALANVSLSAIDTFKVGATGLPLTMLDIRIAAANPAGLWDALQWPAWTRYLTLAAIALGALYLLYEASVTAHQVLRAGAPRPLAARAARRALGLALVGLLAAVYFQRLFQQLGGYDETWDTVGVAAMASEIGVLPYLVYSQHVESTRTGDFFDGQAGPVPPSADAIREAVLRYVDFGSALSARAGGLPNIVILLAESTFDPNTAFRLDQRVRSSLFEPGEGTAAVGPFHVNVIGGGTWVTEFETITGLDSRLFGYSGYYTHSSLSHYVTRDLFTHLEWKGYHTAAFFPHDGKFYNYRNAYRAYGADRIFDSADQGLADSWSATDKQVIDAYQRIMGPAPGAPFLSYVLLNENHGPHPCRVAGIGEMRVRFVDTTEFAPNCSLHEYLRRLASTEAAVASLVGYLRGIEAREGRPFVLLMFGDHQPYTFTGNEWDRFDFQRVRTAAAMNQTFFHLISSVAGGVKCCLDEIPASLVPTLLSAYAADGPDDVYLGVNLWLYERCGADALTSEPLTGLFHLQNGAAPDDLTETARSDRRSGSCASAYAAALRAWRQSGIIGAAPEPSR